MSANFDEVTMIQRLSGEIAGLVSQLQAMTTSNRVDLKSFKSKQKELTAKTKMIGLVIEAVVTRIAATNNKD